MKKLKHGAILFGLFCVVFLFAEYALAADINGQLKKAQLEQFSSAPTGSLSRIFYDTTANQCKVYNGSVWLPIPFAAAALTQGSVPFSDSGGNLAQDNTNFYWDAGNARLGIGTASFANINDKLDVLSSGDVRLALTSTLGIGNASFWLRANSIDQFVFSSNTTATDATTISSTPLRFGTANTVAMTIDTAQKVGVGTQSPSSLFSVGSGSKFQVDSSGNIVKLNNVAMTWPAAHGSTGQLLSDSDGAGTLTWATGLTTARTISTTAPITGGGDLSANRTIAITQAATAANGYLSSTDWNTFNGKGGGTSAPYVLANFHNQAYTTAGGVQTLVFDVITDIASNFATNVFTAPTAGRYLVTLQWNTAAVSGSVTSFEIVLRKNTVTLLNRFPRPLGATNIVVNQSGATSAVVDLAATDTLDFKISVTGGTSITFDTSTYSNITITKVN